MAKGITVELSGPGASETAKALLRRLLELGCRVEHVDGELAQRLGPCAGTVCGLLTRNGVVVVATAVPLTPEGDCVPVDISPNDTPDFAAEKILDTLAESGVVSLETNEYSPEEEEEIRQRLTDLGYIE